MKTCRVAAFGAMLAIGCGCASNLAAQDNEEAGAITARVHGTFLDAAGGLGVLSGDMSVVRFEVRLGTTTAVGRIVGTLADGAGNVLGPVDQELALPVGNVSATCNQLRMELAAADADVLRVAVHFDAEVAGFDSRDGAAPKALDVLCAAGELLRGKPTTDALTRSLDAIAIAVRSPSR